MRFTENEAEEEKHDNGTSSSPRDSFYSRSSSIMGFDPTNLAADEEEEEFEDAIALPED